MPRLILANEERLARQRARWARQAAQRKAERAAAAYPMPKLTSGVSTVRKERLITPHMMAVREAYFWAKRGINSRRDFNKPPHLRTQTSTP